MPIDNNKPQNNATLEETCVVINGVKTDIPIHIVELVDSESDLVVFSKRLAQNCNISYKEAYELLNGIVTFANSSISDVEKMSILAQLKEKGYEDLDESKIFITDEQGRVNLSMSAKSMLG